MLEFEFEDFEGRCAVAHRPTPKTSSHNAMGMRMVRFPIDRSAEDDSLGLQSWP